MKYTWTPHRCPRDMYHSRHRMWCWWLPARQPAHALNIARCGTAPPRSMTISGCVKSPTPRLTQYLEAENAYIAAMTKDLQPFSDALYKEMLGRIKQTDLS